MAVQGERPVEREKEEINMLHFKSCPKCITGTIEHNYDTHGAFAQCLNCGFMRDLPDGVRDAELTKLLAVWRSSIAAIAQEGEPVSVDAVA